MTRHHLALLTIATCAWTLCPASAEEGFALKETPGQFLDFLHNGKIVGRYMIGHDVSTPEKRDDNYKPYCHVFDAAGSAPITKGPGGLFPHHRGIYIGWMKISVNGKTYDRWHMKGGDQIHEKFLTQSASAQQATCTSLVTWTGDGPEAILQEERTLTFLPAPAPGYAMIDVTSKLKAVAGETQLDGDPEHAGLQFRPANEVKTSDTTYLFPKANADAHKDRDYPWFGETFTLNDKHYSVLYFNHPSNPTDAPISAYRDYGRFGAFFHTTIPKDGTLTLRVRFLIIEGGQPPAEAIQKMWNDYAQAQQPTPEITVKPAEPSAPAK